MAKNIFVVTGFLGSGKTTYIVKLLDLFSEMGIKTALIINEIGEIGIDNQYIRQLDHNIYELFGGCICCTLSIDLENTIDEIAQKYKPKVIMVEPSGIANPVQTLKSLSSKSDTYFVTNFFILDPTRLDMFIEILMPLFESSIKSASVILINKINLVNNDTLEECQRLIGVYNQTAKIFRVDFEQFLPTDLKEHINSLLR
jgi:G3E family GTPase